MLADILLALCAAVAARLAFENSISISARLISLSSFLLRGENKLELREQWLSDSGGIEGDANRLFHALGIPIVVVRILVAESHSSICSRISSVGDLLDVTMGSALLASSTKVHLVHGSRAHPDRATLIRVTTRDRTRLILKSDKYARKHRIHWRKLLLAKVCGNSFSHMGFYDGSCLLALRVSPSDLNEDMDGQMVIVDAGSAFARSSKRLRLIHGVAGDGLVSFKRHRDGSVHQCRPKDEICAVVLV